jgi:hypothetical protein
MKTIKQSAYSALQYLHVCCYVQPRIIMLVMTHGITHVHVPMWYDLTAAMLRLIYQGIHSVVKVMTHNQFIETQELGPIILGTDWIYLFTHIKLGSIF